MRGKSASAILAGGEEGILPIIRCDDMQPLLVEIISNEGTDAGVIVYDKDYVHGALLAGI